MTESREYIENILANPYTPQERTYERAGEKGEYSFKERFELRGDQTYPRIVGTIECGLCPRNFLDPFGSVDIEIEIETLLKENKAKFGYLEVSSRVERKGIGQETMISALDFIKAVKEYYDLKEQISFSGWLSLADSDNGNWKRSVPLYHKVGITTKTEHYFTVHDDQNKYLTPNDFFSNVGRKEGNIVYII